jgi:uncharacterized membrane protein
MTLAAIGDTTYNLVLVLHLASVIVAFAPAVSHPLAMARARRHGPEAVARVLEGQATSTARVHLPALVVTGLLGLALLALSDGVWGFDQTWVSLAFLVWIGLAATVFGLILPSERRLGAGETGAERQLNMGGGLATVLLLAMLYLMVFKPGG